MRRSIIKPNDKWIYIKWFLCTFSARFTRGDERAGASLAALYKRFCARRVSFGILIQSRLLFLPVVDLRLVTRLLILQKSPLWGGKKAIFYTEFNASSNMPALNQARHDKSCRCERLRAVMRTICLQHNWEAANEMKHNSLSVLTTPHPGCLTSSLPCWMDILTRLIDIRLHHSLIKHNYWYAAFINPYLPRFN